MRHYTEEDIREIEASLDAPDEATFNLTVSVGMMRDFVALVRAQQGQISETALTRLNHGDGNGKYGNQNSV